MVNRLTVHNHLRPVYDICLDSSFEALAEELTPLDTRKRKVCIVTDSHVGPLYEEEVTEILNSCFSQVTSFVFSAGEEQKTLDTVRKLYKVLIRDKFDRNDFLVALGGGVVGDLCGFAAATYLRGIRFIQIPTTLLSQVDSSIGGKTGVDFDSYKNMVGAFHMPSLVFTNISVLTTLSDEQFSSGMGEVIKHGLIQDAHYYEWLSRHRDEIWNRDLTICENMILKSDQIKRHIVEEDPKEQGKRALLNFGHTLGHAIEKLKNFELLHGHCVGLGILAAAYISVRRGWITATKAENLRQLMQSFHMPVTVDGLSSGDIIEATRMDKKMEAGKIRFILLKSIGDACIDTTVTDEEMEEGLRFILI